MSLSPRFSFPLILSWNHRHSFFPYSPPAVISSQFSPLLSGTHQNNPYAPHPPTPPTTHLNFCPRPVRELTVIIVPSITFTFSCLIPVVHFTLLYLSFFNHLSFPAVNIDHLIFIFLYCSPLFNFLPPTPSFFPVNTPLSSPLPLPPHMPGGPGSAYLCSDVGGLDDHSPGDDYLVRALAASSFAPHDWSSTPTLCASVYECIKIHSV